MHTLAYPIGDRLYLNITDRCTLRCSFCPKHRGSRAVKGYDLTLHHRPEVEAILEAVGDPTVYREVVFCGYGEPTLRLKAMLSIAEDIKAKGGRVRLNTDGLANRVYRRDVLPSFRGRIDALSVSMNAQNEAIYNRHCRPALRGSYEAMLAFLREAPRHVPQVTATAIDGLPGVDIAACAEKARSLGVAFRRRVLDNVG